MSVAVVEIDPTDDLPRSFGHCLRALREREGLTRPGLLRQLARPFSDCDKARIGHWEYLGSPPLERHRDFIAALDVALNANLALVRRLEASLKDNDWTTLKEQEKRCYRYWNDRLEEEFQHLQQFKETKLPGWGVKRGRFAAWRRKASAAKARKDLTNFMGYCILSREAEDLRVRGEGMRADELTLALVADGALFLRYLKFMRSRSLSGSYFPAMISIMGMMRTFVAKDEGYFWQYADRFTHYQALIARCPSHEVLPGGRNGLVITDPARRLRELCEYAQQIYTQSMDAFRRDDTIGYSRVPTDNIETILAKFEYPVDALMLLHARLLANIPSRQQLRRWAEHIQTILLTILMTVEPLRLGTLAQLVLGDFMKVRGSWHANVPRGKFKNADAGAKNGWHGILPPLLQLWLEFYLTHARSHLLRGIDTDMLFVGRNGRLKEAGLYHRIKSTTKTFLHDYAPNGINPQAWRHIVATDCVARDPVSGLKTAEGLLKDKPRTITATYAHLQEQKARNILLQARYDSLPPEERAKIEQLTQQVMNTTCPDPRKTP